MMSRTKRPHPLSLLSSARPPFALVLLLCLFYLPPPSVQHLLSRKTLCYIACEDSFYNSTFATANANWTGAETRCLDYLRVASTYACMQQRCTSQEIHDGVHLLEGACLEKPGTAPPPFASVIANVTGGGAGGHHDGTKLADLPVVSGSDVVEGRPFNTTVLPSQELFDVAYRTWVSDRTV
jgi:hypothetical protein